MLAARAMMSALLCGTLRTFFADFLSLFNGTNSTFVLGDGFLTRLLMVSSPLWFWGSAQNPRMNPCPSARPGVEPQGGSERGLSEAPHEGPVFGETWGCGSPCLDALRARGAAPLSTSKIGKRYDEWRLATAAF
jgi:hypothetical protein